MERFRIGYFADGLWAHNAFKLLIADPQVEICFICVRYDSIDSTLADYAQAYDIPLLKVPSINAAEFITLVKSYRCDLFVSMSFNQIFRDEITNVPKYKTINCHAGKLPFYRGRNILNWALINDEKEFGITVHYIDKGIDTGDIILQKTFAITEEDTYKTLLETAHVECAVILKEAIDMVIGNVVEPVKQTTIHPVGFYCSARGQGDEILNWQQSSRDIFNFVRAICAPGPQARSFLGTAEIKINKATLIPDAPVYKGNPGQIVGKNGTTIIVKTLDTTIALEEYSSDVKIKIGDKLK